MSAWFRSKAETINRLAFFNQIDYLKILKMLEMVKMYQSGEGRKPILDNIDSKGELEWFFHPRIFIHFYYESEQTGFWLAALLNKTWLQFDLKNKLSWRICK